MVVVIIISGGGCGKGGCGKDGGGCGKSGGGGGGGSGSSTTSSSENSSRISSGNPSKSQGPDGIPPPRFLDTHATYLAPIRHDISQSILDSVQDPEA